MVSSNGTWVWNVYHNKMIGADKNQLFHRQPSAVGFSLCRGISHSNFPRKEEAGRVQTAENFCRRSFTYRDDVLSLYDCQIEWTLKSQSAQRKNWIQCGSQISSLEKILGRFPKRQDHIEPMMTNTNDLICQHCGKQSKHRQLGSCYSLIRC